ncbi:hypothetical protein GCM10007426_26110 [Alloalcanivorax dieselolei]|nr:hypothetical protein GCM10007426_26110 [Alloalcanivorax dieselolei]
MEQIPGPGNLNHVVFVAEVFGQAVHQRQDADAGGHQQDTGKGARGRRRCERRRHADLPARLQLVQSALSHSWLGAYHQEPVTGLL